QRSELSAAVRWVGMYRTGRNAGPSVRAVPLESDSSSRSTGRAVTVTGPPQFQHAASPSGLRPCTSQGAQCQAVRTTDGGSARRFIGFLAAVPGLSGRASANGARTYRHPTAPSTVALTTI